MINVAIDGPAGAGKSTVAKAVASKLGLVYLDTGAMYRATAYTALESGIDPCDGEAVEKMLEGMKLEIVFEDGVQQIYVNGVNTTPHLREHRMSKAASDISALPCVRYKMVELQREFAAARDVVLDGRDIGTFVLPNANCKFFMTATAEERANRRFKELVEKGQDVDYDTLLADIKQRDYNDSHREVAPLKQAEDAILLDTTNMTIDEVVAAVVERVEQTRRNSDGEGKGQTPSSDTADEKSDNKKAEETAAPLTRKQKREAKKEEKLLKRIKKYYAPDKTFRMYRFLRVFLHPLQAFLWPIKAIGAERGRIDGNAIYVCNHYSGADILLPCYVLFKDEAHVLAKYELFKHRLVGWFLHKLGAIPVRRGEADIDAVKSVLKVLKEGKKLMLFPEGTRNLEGSQDMADLKTGAARFAIKTKSPIVPMMYYAPPKLFKRNWLYIGEPFTLEQFYGSMTPEDMHAATEIIRQKMDEARAEVNRIAEEAKRK